MGGKGTARERAAVGLMPMAGIDMTLEEAEAYLATLKPEPAKAPPAGGRVAAGATELPPGGVTATVEALSQLIESRASGIPRQDLGAASPAAAGKVRGRRPLRDRLRPRAQGRPAAGDRRAGRRRQRAGARPGAPRRHRLGQDLHHGQGDRGDAAAGAGAGAEQDARRPALWRVQSFFPENAVEYFVSYYDYYQPEAYVPRTDTYIEKESPINEQIDRMRHSATRGAARARRRDHRRLGVVHLRHRLGRDLYGDDLRAHRRRAHRPAPAARRPRRAPVQAHRHGFPPRHVPRPRRHRRPLPGASGGPRLAHHAVRRRDRIDRRVRSAHRRALRAT